MNERKARALIEQHFVEALAPAKFKKLWEHVSKCAPCKAHYDKLFSFEAKVDGGKAEVERIGQALFAELEPKRTGLFAGALAFTWPFPRIVAAGAAALLLVVVVAPRLGRGPADDEFAARGGPEYGPELLATCFRDVGGRIEGAQALDGNSVPVCPRGGRLAFAYRNAREGEQLAVFAVRGKEVSRLVEPLALATGSERRAVPGSFAIDASAPVGEVRLVAVFGAELVPARIEATLQTGAELKDALKEGATVRRLGYRLDKP